MFYCDRFVRDVIDGFDDKSVGNNRLYSIVVVRLWMRDGCWIGAKEHLHIDVATLS